MSLGTVGGDQTTTVECPLCGTEVPNNRLPMHIRGECDA